MHSPVRTKIFISSSAQDEFRRLRDAVYTELQAMGHQPMMYERNFGAWESHTNPLQKCIECVNECDIFLLFVYDKAGTFYAQTQRTATHLELIEAMSKQKTVLVFVESVVKKAFFAKAKGTIAACIDRYKTENQRIPTAAEIAAALEEHDGLPRYVDPYIWFFLDDMYKRGLYFADLDLGVPHEWKDYFSDLLRRGVKLLPAKDEMESNERLLDLFEQFHETLDLCLPHLNVACFHNTKAFLEGLMAPMAGDAIIQDFGYVQEPIGRLDDCSAVTLYVRQDDRMVLVEKAGAADGEPFYMLDNVNSFVSLTYRTSRSDQLFFKEANRTFYFCLRMPEHVMTFHFPCDPTWDADKFMAFKDQVNRVILKRNAMAFEFARKLIGGFH